MSEGEANTLERLLAQEGWLRSLARALVSEPSVADDVAQETWARVLAAPPPAVDSPRAWLARIARRVVGERVRDERSRRRRERIAASERPEAVDEVAWAGRVESAAQVQQRLARAVLALSEPGRSAVVLRYFEGRSAARIARETGVPESTVRNRLRRALAELREALDREAGGDRSRWLPALAPIAGSARTGSWPWPLAAAAEVLLMGTKAKLVLSAAALALAALPLLLLGGGTERAHDAGELVVTQEPDGTELDSPALEPSSTRVAVESVAVPAEAPGSAATTPATLAALPPGFLEVVVVRRSATANEPDVPVTGGDVWLGLSGVFLPRELDEENDLLRVARLDAGGIARFSSVPPGRYPVGVAIGQALLQTSVNIRATEGTRALLTLGDSGLRGTVRDPGGPVASGARLQISPLTSGSEGKTRPRFVPLGTEFRLHAIVWTDANGRYEAPYLPSGGYGVGVDLSGTQNPLGGEYGITLDLPAGAILEHDFGQPEGLPLWRGRVRTRAGAPALNPKELPHDPGTVHLTRTDRWSYNHHAWQPDGGIAIRLESGTYDVAISFPGRDERFLLVEGFTVEPGRREVELDLTVPGATVSGFVAQGKWISVRADLEDRRPFVWMQRPDDGSYRFDGIAPGRWWLTAEGPTADRLAVEFTVLETDEIVIVDL